MTPEDNNVDRIRVTTYMVVPYGYDDMVHVDKSQWCLFLVDGMSDHGWAIRRGSSNAPVCMNEHGELESEPIPSSRTTEWLQAHRWPLPFAAQLALRHVDDIELNGRTALEAHLHVAQRLANTRPDNGQESPR